MSGEEFAIKFNLQKLLGFGIDDDDNVRIAQVLNCPFELVGEVTSRYKSNNSKQAEVIIESNDKFRVMDKDCKKTIAFIGDSITSDRESYFNIIKAAFEEFKNIKLIDAAVSGDRTANAVMCLYERVIKHKPDIVSVMIGTNDTQKSIDNAGICVTSAGEYERNLRHIIERLLQEKTSVIISTLPPMDDSFDYTYGEVYKRYDAANLMEYNSIIRKLSCEYDLVLNDLSGEYSKYPPEKLLLGDGIHLSPFAQRMAAARLLPVIAGLIGKGA